MSMKAGRAPHPHRAPGDDGHARNGETHVVEVDPRGSRRRGVFTVTGGAQAGRVLSIEPGVVVMFGRAPDCTFPFEDASLSREHACVMVVGSEHVFKDAGSTNGSFVNDLRVTKATKLEDGDRVQLGRDTMLRFALVDEDEERAMRRVYESAIRDGLTGVFNRKHLDERLDAEIAHARRAAADLGVAVLDIDHFKRINDTHGHLAGDAVLRAVAQTLASGLRVDDLVARYGGEEFVLVSRGADLAATFALADRLRVALEAASIAFEGRHIPVTTSVGVASLREGAAIPDKTTLLATADARLYRAKQSGRNRIVAD
jgi:diguanylate cyclase (GGDEF)-like protein